MADALVRLLNQRGYLPIFLPRTGLEPPELYSFARQKNELVRWGALRQFLPQGTAFRPKSSQVSDIEHLQTSGKKQSLALDFLSRALKCVGIEGAPKLDLSFSGAEEYRFSFSGLTAKSVDPAALRTVIQGLELTGIPQRYLEMGGLHIAYEYLYAQKLLMSRSDQRGFRQDISGAVGQYLDLGAKGSVRVESETTISFSGQGGVSAAFAYKAARILQGNNGWELYPEEQMADVRLETRPFLPARGVALGVMENADKC